MKETIVSKYHFSAIGGIEMDKKGNLGRVVMIKDVRSDCFRLLMPNYKSFSTAIYHIVNYDRKTRRYIIRDENGETKKVSWDRYVFVSDFDRW